MPVPMYFGGGGGGGGGGSVHLSHQTVCPAHKTTSSSSREHGWLGVSPDNAGMELSTGALQTAQTNNTNLLTVSVRLCACVRVFI
eukprot:COSAG06_NODE_286_length_18312_cov_90.377752_1_plen_85_part_00